MPGVGLIDLNSTHKTIHAESIVFDEHGKKVKNRSVNGMEQSTLCHKALSRPHNSLSITELRLGPNKPPCCIVLMEDIAAYEPPKSCRSSA
jgi:hypothetical protein